MEKAKQVLELIVRSIVDYPDQVEINATRDDRGVLLLLRVDKRDMGKVIGRQGSMATSIRTIMKSVGATEKANVSFKIEEDMMPAKDAIPKFGTGLNDFGTEEEGMRI